MARGASGSPQGYCDNNVRQGKKKMSNDDLHLALSRGWTAGNYATAYHTDLDAALEVSDDGPARTTRALRPVYRAAFIVGFFARHEPGEVPEKYRATFEQSLRDYSEAMRAIGIAVD
jgi:hypothetical protein